MDWATLFAETKQTELSVPEISSQLEELRENRDRRSTATAVDEPGDPSPVRIVVDVDVLVADVFNASSPARTVMDKLWEHSWIKLVGSDQLLTETTSLLSTVGDESLATAWRSLIEEWRTPVTHPNQDHPALGSAYRGGAMHILSYDKTLTGPRTATALQGRFPVSIRTPDAFNAIFSPSSLYQEISDTKYDGPDRLPRKNQS